MARAVLLVAAGALTACTGSPQPPPAAKPVTTGPDTVATAATAVSQAPETTAPASPKYGSRARRDPFEMVEVRQGSGPSVASAKLTGIVRGARGPLALVETADGLGYILKPGDTLGDGRLLEIGPNRVVFSITASPGLPTNRVVLNLAGDQ
jgi:Tfp pilus assembly protein PilP